MFAGAFRASLGQQGLHPLFVVALSIKYDFVHAA
jgi:hypothetical protein